MSRHSDRILWWRKFDWSNDFKPWKYAGNCFFFRAKMFTTFQRQPNHSLSSWNWSFHLEHQIHVPAGWNFCCSSSCSYFFFCVELMEFLCLRGLFSIYNSLWADSLRFTAASTLLRLLPNRVSLSEEEERRSRPRPRTIFFDHESSCDSLSTLSSISSSPPVLVPFVRFHPLLLCLYLFHLLLLSSPIPPPAPVPALAAILFFFPFSSSSSSSILSPQKFGVERNSSRLDFGKPCDDLFLFSCSLFADFSCR